MNKVLIVIPCLNEEKYIENTTLQILENTKNFERLIVIVDGGSTDRTLNVIRNLSEKYEGVTYLHNLKRIQSAAVNLAVSTFGQDFDFLIRIDAHSDYPADYCSKLLEEAQKMNADSVVVSMLTTGRSWFQRAVAAAQNSKLGNGGSSHRNRHSDGCWIEHGHHALFTMHAFRSIGGYDETFSHNEDAELDYRLLKAGFRIWLTAATSIIYYPRTNAKSLFFQYFNFGYGRAKTLIKHKLKPKLRQSVPLIVAPATLLFILSLPLHSILSIPFLIWSSVCILYGLALSRKEKKLEVIFSGPALMVMHFAWSLGFWKSCIEFITKKINHD
jgi:succinoglycan biosynthesis protein ExoA